MLDIALSARRGRHHDLGDHDVRELPRFSRYWASNRRRPAPSSGVERSRLRRSSLAPSTRYAGPHPHDEAAARRLPRPQSAGLATSSVLVRVRERRLRSRPADERADSEDGSRPRRPDPSCHWVSRQSHVWTGDTDGWWKRSSAQSRRQGHGEAARPQLLTLAGAYVWFDDWEVRAGDSIPGKVNDALASVDTLVLLWSARADRSKWVRAELETAITRSLDGEDNVRVIPVRLDGTTLPALLRRVKWVDLADDDVARAVNEIMGFAQISSG